MAKETGFLVEVDYEQWPTGQSVIQAFFRTKNGLEDYYFPEFLPYLFVASDNPAVKAQIQNIRIGPEQVAPQKIEETQKSDRKMLKVFFNSTKELVMAREELLNHGYSIFEFDIPFGKRFLIDRAYELYCEFDLEYNTENGKRIVTSIHSKKPQSLFFPKMAAIDIETYSPGRFPVPQKDAILMIGIATNQDSTILTTHEKGKGLKNVKVYPDEPTMLKAFFLKLNELDLDVLITYNGDSFDLPYLTERAKKFGIHPGFGFAGSEMVLKRRGLENAARLKGIQHLDAYQAISLLSRFGAVNLVKKDLESVVHELFGYPKNKVTPKKINEIWDTGEGFEELVKYNREDTEYTLRIVNEYYPLLLELSKIVRFSLFDVCRASASLIVEGLLLIKSNEKSAFVPNKPDESMVHQRLMQSVVGGYVKEPVPGLHENIAVLDFRSLYPSIIVSHNISPDTYKGIAPKGTDGKNISPDGDWFAQDREGFFVSIVNQLLELRTRLKKEYRAMDKTDPKSRLLFGRQWALKIILNSFYGTMGFAQFRWYSRECARAVTAFARHYIQQVVADAEKAGFRVLYGDTDSTFLLIPSTKTKEDVKEFVKQVNDRLPETMELEIEDFYKRGIFVTKKDPKGGAAKKRYALINFSDQLKIVGFEYVRRDWSQIAKKTQRGVIEALLKEGDPKKSVEIVKEAIKRLQEGQVPKKELVVLTQIKRKLDKYDSIGPHVAAAKKAVDRGKEIEIGSVIGFIVTKGNGKSISERAELEEYVKEGNYDSEYYIHHQVLPAILRILNELGYSEQDLLQGGKQSRLF